MTRRRLALTIATTTLATAVAATAQSVPTPVSDAAEEGSATGTLTVNGEAVELLHAYVYAQKERLRDNNEPLWSVIISAEPIAERDLDEPLFDFPYLWLGILNTTGSGDAGEPELVVYSQTLSHPALAANISASFNGKIELTSFGPERFAGRLYLPEPVELFDDTFQYDLTFSAPLSDPNAPIGEPLPAGGGAPGEAFLAWVKAVHSGDIEEIKKLVPPESASEMEEEDPQTIVEFMQSMTPTDVQVIGGSSDGETAILDLAAVVEGEKVNGEATMVRRGDRWLSAGGSWRP